MGNVEKLWENRRESVGESVLFQLKTLVGKSQKFQNWWKDMSFAKVLQKFYNEIPTGFLVNNSLLNRGFPRFPHSLLLSLLNI